VEIQVVAQPDIRLFTVFALLNTIGYNTENGWQFNKVRTAVRLKLARRAAYWRSALSEAGLLEVALRAGGAMMMDIVPLLTLPPDLTFYSTWNEYSTSWQRESKESLLGIDTWLQRFYKEESINTLWSEHLSAHEDLGTLLQQLSTLLDEVAERFEGRSNTDKLEIVLIPNLLDAGGRGYSLSTYDRTWLFLGAISEVTQAKELIIHELLHRWVDVAAERVCTGSSADPMPQARARFRMVADSYPDLTIWVGETVARATTIWLMTNFRNLAQQHTNELLLHHEQIGFIGIQEAYSYLAGEPRQSLEEVIQETVELVYHKVVTDQMIDA
jgi:hypothetical protein